MGRLRCSAQAPNRTLKKTVNLLLTREAYRAATARKRFSSFVFQHTVELQLKMKLPPDWHNPKVVRNAGTMYGTTTRPSASPELSAFHGTGSEASQKGT
jgi:hypothetical protein